MQFRSILLATALVVLWGAGSIVGATDQASPAPTTDASVQQPGAVMPELKFEFDPVVDGTMVTHNFVIKNIGEGVLDISKVKTG